MTKKIKKKCYCINDGKKHNYCKHWNDRTQKPWCYTEKCGEYSKSTKKYFKYCNEKDVNDKCNHDDHCFNSCKIKGSKKYWCYVKKKSKNICTFEGDTSKKFGGKTGNQWSYEPCKNLDKIMKNNNFQKLLEKTITNEKNKITQKIKDEQKNIIKKMELIEEKENKENEIKFKKKLKNMVQKITLKMENEERKKNKKIESINNKKNKEYDDKFKEKLNTNIKKIKSEINNKEEKERKKISDKNLINKFKIQNLNNKLEKEAAKNLDKDNDFIQKDKIKIQKYIKDTSKKQKDLMIINDKIQQDINKINAYNDDEYIKKLNEFKKIEVDKKNYENEYNNYVKNNTDKRDKEVKKLQKKVKDQKKLNKRKENEKQNEINNAIANNKAKKINIKNNNYFENAYKTDLIKQTISDRNQYEKKTLQFKSKNRTMEKKYNAVTSYFDISKKIDESKKNMKKNLRINKEGYRYGPAKSYHSKNLEGTKGTYNFTRNERQSLTTRFRTCYKKCMNNKDCRSFSTTKNVCQLATGPNNYPHKTRMYYEKCKKDWKGNKYYGNCYIHNLNYKDYQLKPRIMETEFEIDADKNNWGNRRNRETDVGKKIYGQANKLLSYNLNTLTNARYFQGTSTKVSFDKQNRQRGYYSPKKKCLVGVEYSFPRGYKNYDLYDRGCSYSEVKEQDDRYDIPGKSKHDTALWRVTYSRPKGIKWGKKCPQWVNRFSVYNSKTGELLGKCGSSDFTPITKDRKEAKNKKFFCQISHDNSIDFKSSRDKEEVIIKADSCGYTFKPIIRKWAKKRYGEWKEKEKTIKWKYPCHMKGKLKWMWTDSDKCLTR
jgi:hypothetical protein